MEEIIKECLPTYSVVDKLGEGVYGSVYRIKDAFKERAAKVVPLTAERTLSSRSAEALDSRISRDFHSVREYYDAIRGTGVIDVYDFHMVGKQVSNKKAKAYLVILMELYPENLQDHVLDRYPLSGPEILNLMRQLSGVLLRLTQSGPNAFLVTDLKPSNLLLNRSRELLIGDLGGVKRLSSVSTIAGSQFSPSWCAPEIMLKGASPGISSTIYAYGLVSYFAWEGKVPHEDQDFSLRPGMIREEGIPFTRKDIPESIRRLICSCLSFDTAGRPDGFDAIHRQIPERQNGETDVPAIFPPTKERSTGSVSPGEHRTVKRKTSIQDCRKPASMRTWTEPVSGMQFVRVPGGEFMMGGIEGDGRVARSEKPARRMVMDSFWIGKYPVTQQQWRAIMGRNPSHFKKGDRYPVEQVSWNDALTFILRLSSHNEGDYEFRLPTEAQWEYAARSGGLAEPFSGGSDPAAYAWYRENSEFMTHPVGEKKPNGLGIHDMSGNVMEWCSDLFTTTAYRHGTAGKSESGDSRSARACRGGSWTHGVDLCRTTARRGVPAGLRYTSLGFRLLRMD